MIGIANWTRGRNKDGWLADWMWGNVNGMEMERRMHGLRARRGRRGKERGGDNGGAEVGGRKLVGSWLDMEVQMEGNKRDGGWSGGRKSGENGAVQQ